MTKDPSTNQVLSTKLEHSLRFRVVLFQRLMCLVSHLGKLYPPLRRACFLTFVLRASFVFGYLGVLFISVGCAAPRGSALQPVSMPAPSETGHFIHSVPWTTDPQLDAYGQVLERITARWQPQSRRFQWRRQSEWDFDWRNPDGQLEALLRERGLWSVWATGTEAKLRERVRADVPVWIFLQENPFNRATLRPAIVVGFDTDPDIWWITGLDEPPEEWAGSELSSQWSSAGRHWVLIAPPEAEGWELSATERHARGRYWMALGQYAEAADDFGVALTLEPNQPLHYIELADSHLRRQQFAAAEPLYRAALTLAADNARALNNLAYLLVHAEGDLEEAVRLARRAVSLAPDNPRLLDTLGVALHRRGDDREAARMLQRARTRALDADVDTQTTIALHLVAVYHDTGEEHLARQTLADALALNPRLSVPGEYSQYLRPGRVVPR